jgi:phospholipase C
VPCSERSLQRTVKVGHALTDLAQPGPDWNSTVVFVTWDDFGGFYDHVPPPSLAAHSLGLRVPLLILSPYARKGYVSHTEYDFSSFLKFAELRFHLPALNGGTPDGVSVNSI